jgi:hypothetical protein
MLGIEVEVFNHVELGKACIDRTVGWFLQRLRAQIIRNMYVHLPRTSG